jgi:hypothetical protein
MNPPGLESQYVTSLHEVFWGGTLVAVTMVLHALGMLTILRVNLRLKHRLGEQAEKFFVGVGTLILASWMILVVHLVEVAVWAAFFFWQGAFPNGSLSYYFSLNEYTTVGSNFSLPLHWRLLEGMIATAGLLTFAWSTGVLLTLAQDFQEQQLQLFKRERKTDPTKNVPPAEPSGPDPRAGRPS